MIPIGMSWSSTITNNRSCVEANVSNTYCRLSSCLQHSACGTFWFYISSPSCIPTRAGIAERGCSNRSMSMMSSLKMSLRWKMVVILPSSFVTRMEEIFRLSSMKSAMMERWKWRYLGQLKWRRGKKWHPCTCRGSIHEWSADKWQRICRRKKLDDIGWSCMWECRELGCSRMEMMNGNYLDDWKTPNLVLWHNMQNIDKTRRWLTVEKALLRFALQLEFYDQARKIAKPLYVLMLMSKISFTLSGWWRCMLICMSTALIKSLLLKMPIKQFFSWFQITASATSTHDTELSSRTLRAKAVKCQTDRHVRIEHRYLSTPRKSVIRCMCF